MLPPKNMKKIQKSMALLMTKLIIHCVQFVLDEEVMLTGSVVAFVNAKTSVSFIGFPS